MSKPSLKESKACLQVVVLMLVVQVLTPGQMRASTDLLEKNNQTIRQKSFEFLFSEFVEDKKCVWDKSGSQLSEVVVFERDKNQIDTWEETKQVITLAKGADRVAVFFDQLVLRGDLSQVKSVKLLIGTKVFRAKVIKNGDDVCSFRIPPLPLMDGLSDSKMQLVVIGDLEVDEVAFVSLKPIENSFEDYSKRTSNFLSDRNDLSYKSQKAFLEKVRDASMKILAASLRDQTDEFARIIVPAQLTAGPDIISINGVIADRRVSKLHEELGRMASEEAANLASSNFQEEFSRFKQDWESANMLPARKRYASEALLFLSSEFCSADTFLKHVDQWHAWHNKHKENKGRQFKFRGGPDFLLVANLYANAAIKQKDLSIDEANAWLSLKLGPVFKEQSGVPKLEQRWLPSSDWTPDRIDLIADVPAFQTFGSMLNSQTQERVLSILRAEIE